MLRIETLEKWLVFGFAATLLCLPACDKPAADKAVADKAVADEPGPAAKASDDKPEPAAAEVTELSGDGRVEVSVDASGYHPAEVRAPAGSKVMLAFTRTTEQGCGQELVIESMEIKKQLPLDEAVEIEVVVPASGEVGFTCGMNMYQGKVVPKA
jgi:plastocyanin